jgi:hypothetical protein
VPVAGAKDSVTVWLPDVALLPGQPSLSPPPVAEQLVAFEELHVTVTASPGLIDVGEAEIVAVTVGQLQTTEADTLTPLGVGPGTEHANV